MSANVVELARLAFVADETDASYLLDMFANFDVKLDEELAKASNVQRSIWGRSVGWFFRKRFR